MSASLSNDILPDICVPSSPSASDAQTRWQGCHSDRRRQGDWLWGSPPHGQTGSACYHRYSIKHHTTDTQTSLEIQTFQQHKYTREQKMVSTCFLQVLCINTTLMIMFYTLQLINKKCNKGRRTIIFNSTSLVDKNKYKTEFNIKDLEDRFTSVDGKNCFSDSTLIHPHRHFLVLSFSVVVCLLLCTVSITEHYGEKTVYLA